MLRVVLPLVVTSSAAAAAVLIRALCWGSSDDETPASKSRGGVRIQGPAERLASRDPDEVALVSYNVLAACFAAKLSDYASEAHLAWGEARWPRLQEQIASWQADLVLLQEVDVLWLAEWLHFGESLGYAALHQEPKGRQVVCVTLYRASKLQLWWADVKRSRTLLAAFLFGDSSHATQALYVCNCHLEGSPYKPQERVNQVRSALASLEAHQSSQGLPPAECHTIVAGDLNSGAREAVVRLLQDGWLPAGYREAHLPRHPVVAADVSTPYLLTDAYASAPLPFTRKVPALESTLDHLFVSHSLSVAALLWPLDEACPADRRLPHSRTGLPNALHPSDHLPIGARLRCLPAGVLQA